MSLQNLLDAVVAYAPDADTDLIVKAYFFAARAHDGQTRKSGEAYLTHPLAVACILAEELRMDVDTIATALLHDTMEDCMVTREEIVEAFNPTVGELVEGVTKIGKLHFRSKAEAAAENFRKMMLAMSKDVRVILVKLADRLHNMRTLGVMRLEKRQRIAQETMDIYVPLAGRLGIMSFRTRLEDLCFEQLYPEAWADMDRRIAETREEREAYIQRVCGELNERLGSMGLDGEIYGRSKHRYSIYKKMLRNNLAFDEVHDAMAFRVVVEDLAQCYAVLGYVHSFYTPIPERIKDYIAVPKRNGYRSLHTTVQGPENRRVEVQIRTREMHEIAENGIAAHWQYKEGHLALRPEDITKITKLREVYETAQEVQDPEEFMEALKIDLFTEDVFVFTPAGDVKEFPMGSTALDFAYAVHTEVGNRCVGAKANGRMVPFRYELRSGDTMEILTSDQQHPRRDWLEIVKTGRALRAVRKYLHKQERETGVRMGREMLEQELKRRGSTLPRIVKDGTLKRYLKERNFRDVEPLFLELARGHKTPLEIGRALLPETEPEPEPAERPDPISPLTRLLNRLRQVGRADPSPVRIGGEDDVLVQFARCCNPLPGEQVIGYVTRGRGITVHRRTCHQILSLEPERRIPVEWNDGVGTHRGELQIICMDQPGLLANISQLCSDAHINISRVEARPVDPEKSEIDLEIGVGSLDEMMLLIRKISSVDGVLSVRRLGVG